MILPIRSLEFQFANEELEVQESKYLILVTELISTQTDRNLAPLDYKILL